MAKVVANAEGCPEGKPFGAVIDGDSVTCFDSEEAAQAAADGAGAEPGEKAAAVNPRAFTAVLLVEDVETSDGRLLELNGARWRRPPLPLMWQSQNPDSGAGGHAGAGLAGKITSIERSGRRVIARGEIASTPLGDDLLAAMESGMARFISADLGQASIDYEVRAVDEEGWPTDMLARFSSYEIMGGTVVPFSAFAEAVVWLDGQDAPLEMLDDLPPAPARTETPEVVPSLMAAGGPPVPPLEWFLDPCFTEPTGLTVLDDGRVFGHLALWNSCHIGMPGCTTAPRSEAQYAYFRTGATAVTCEDGCSEQIPTGVITLGTTHADLSKDARRTALHYEHTGVAVVDIASGEDEFGIWVAGAVRPGVTEGQIRALRGASLSGDWRSIGGRLELVAALAVNVPGFPVPRTQAHLAASGAPDALVAPWSPIIGAEALAASADGTGLGEWVMVPRIQWEELQADIDTLRPLIADRIAESL